MERISDVFKGSNETHPLSKTSRKRIERLPRLHSDNEHLWCIYGGRKAHRRPRIMFPHPPVTPPSFPSTPCGRIRNVNESLSKSTGNLMLERRRGKFRGRRKEKRSTGQVTKNDLTVVDSPLIKCQLSKARFPLYRWCPLCGSVCKNEKGQKIHFCSLCHSEFCFCCLKSDLLSTCKRYRCFPSRIQCVKPLKTLLKTKSIRYDELRNPNEMSLSGRINEGQIKKTKMDLSNVKRRPFGIFRGNNRKETKVRYNPALYRHRYDINPIIGSTVMITNVKDFNSPKQVITKIPSLEKKKSKEVKNSSERSSSWSEFQKKKNMLYDRKREKMNLMKGDPMLEMFSHIKERKKKEEERRSRAKNTYRNRVTTSRNYFKNDFYRSQISVFKGKL